MPIPKREEKKDDLFFWQIEESHARRGVIYGTGGIGKTRLCCLAPGPVVFIQPDNSLSTLVSEFRATKIPVPQVVPAENWVELRNALQQVDRWKNIKTIVIDSVTAAEEWCIEHVLNTVLVDGKRVDSLEKYGYGKDIRFVYENFLPLLTDLEAHYRAGRNVILIAHDCKPEEINPMGANYMRYEPRLRTSKKGDNSIRLKVKEWSDFVGFLCGDVSPKVEEDKKTAERTKKAALGRGTRTLYLHERPQYMAKGRNCPERIDIDVDTNPWPQIIK